MATVPELVINITTAEIAKLDVRPGDRIVLHCDEPLTNEVIGLLVDRAEALFPDNKVIFMARGLHLGVLREGADEPVMLDTKKADPVRLVSAGVGPGHLRPFCDRCGIGIVNGDGYIDRSEPARPRALCMACFTMKPTPIKESR